MKVRAEFKTYTPPSIISESLIFLTNKKTAGTDETK
jgi:hypothetical protein